MRSFLLGQKTEVSTAVPYIETDGVASYMDLGFVPTESLEFELDFKTETLTSRNLQYIQSCNNPFTARYTLLIDLSDYVYNTRYPSLNLDGVQFQRIKAKYREGVLEFGSDTYTYSYTTSSLTGNMLLGGITGVSTGYSNTRYYGAKYWDVVDGQKTLIRDLVPYSGPRGIGLLDKVNDVLYANANTTGSLTYGEEPA